MAKVRIVENGPTAGVWVEGDKGSIALVYQEGVGPCMILYGKNHRTVPLAISIDPDGKEGIIQVPGPDGTLASGVRFVGMKRLLEAVDSVAPIPATHDCPECGHHHDVPNYE